MAGEPVRDALTRLRERVAESPFPLQTQGASAARLTCGEITAQLDDYVLPRLAAPDAPLLAVVGGPTGAGKSTLVNTLAGGMVSPAGVLRPTTRSPVLLCAREDERWFADARVLPGLTRSRKPAATGDGADGALHLVRCDALPPGLAVLDAPDIDSVVQSNRALAAQLLGAADLWLFVTTAERYTDAVPWEFLLAARERGTYVAVVLDRVPADDRPADPRAGGQGDGQAGGADDDPGPTDATTHFAQLLATRGLGDVPFFVVPEVGLRDGLLPADAVAPVRGWLTHLAGDKDARSRVATGTLQGTIDALSARLVPLTREAGRQDDSMAVLRTAVEAAYRAGHEDLAARLGDGSVVRGEVAVRWQDLAGTGELERAVRAGGPREQADRLRDALLRGLAATVGAVAQSAAERTAAEWVAVPAGRPLLRASGGLGGASPDLVDRVERLVTERHTRVTDLLSEQDAGQGSGDAYYRDVSALILMLVAVAPHDAAAVQDAATRSATRASRKLLEAIFGGEAVRRLAASVRRDLEGDVHAQLAEEARRYTGLLDGAPAAGGRADRLREVQFGLDAARL